ncbi:MAG: hypothetical protein IJ155_04470 [Prevotella sp.]|nr:hypothetical protein [Prevotella sp.]
MAEVDNKQVKSKRQSMTERLQSRYPEKDFSDEESFFGQISDDYDEYDKNIAGYQEREKAFSDMFTSDPRSANFLTNWRKGGDPVVELIRQFGTDIKEVIDDPERQEEIAAANKEFVERVAKEKELEDTYQQNLKASLQGIEELQSNGGLSDDDIDAAMSLLVSIANDAVVGKFSSESIKMALMAIHHDADVNAATEEGVVQGKNTKIEEKLRKPKQGDGTSPLGGSNGGSGGSTRPRPSLGALEGYGDGTKTIWERGGEKRRRDRD